MSILWVALLAVIGFIGMLVTRALLNAEPSKMSLESYGKWTIAFLICLIGSMAILIGWGRCAKTVVIKTEPQEQEMRFLIDASVQEEYLEGTFSVIQVGKRMQYCYIDEMAELNIGTMYESMVEKNFSDWDHNYVIVKRELQTSRLEWGFLRGTKHTEMQEVGYELRIPSMEYIFIMG